MNEDKITVLFDDEYLTLDNPLAAQNVYYFDKEGNKKTVVRNGFLTPRDISE